MPSSRAQLFAIAAVSLAAAALFLCTPQSHVFSDGPYLIGLVQRDATPHYNALYVPTGHLCFRLLNALLGVEVRRALEIHAALATSAGLFFCGLLLRRYTTSIGLIASALVLLALTPAVWFFATTVEVHGVQFCGAAMAFWLAVRAKESKRPILLLGAAWVVALSSHLTCVVLAPFLVVLTLRSPGSQRGLAARDLWRTALFASALVLVVGAGLWLFTELTGNRQSAVSPAKTLWAFGRQYLHDVGQRGAFSWAENWEYTLAEFLLPASLLLLPLPFGLWAARRKHPQLALATLGATIAYLLVFSQGGVWERGAYYLSLYPAYLALLVVFLEALREKRPRRSGLLAALVLLLAVPQAWIARAEIRSHNVGLEAPIWAAQVLEIVPAESLIFTDELPKALALNSPSKYVHVKIVRKELDMWPDRHRGKIAAMILQRGLEALIEGRAVYFDAALFDSARDRHPSVRYFARVVDEVLAEAPGLGRVPVRDAEDRLVLYRVEIAPPR